MDRKFSRTEMLIGNEGMEKLKDAKVAVFGIGGVGSFVCEGLARSGIGNFILVDYDRIDESNINRQLIANTNTIGEYKVDLMKERILEINPDANVETYKEFYMADAYSFDADEGGLDISYDKMYLTFNNIFRRIGIDTLVCASDPMSMNGSASEEFQVISEYGDNKIVKCTNCSYCTNIEVANLYDKCFY